MKEIIKKTIPANATSVSVKIGGLVCNKNAPVIQAKLGGLVCNKNAPSLKK